MSRGCKVTLASLVAVFVAAAVCQAGAMYRNDSGAVARAVRIQFSEPAEITSMWPSFPHRDRQGPATVIVLSGGEITAGGWFSFTWRPDSARVVKIEWLAHLSATKPTALGILWAAGDLAKHRGQLDRTSLAPPSTTPQMGDGLLPSWAWDTPASSYYQERYANLLDALKRISGTDPNTRTDRDAFVRSPSGASGNLVRWDRIVVDLRDVSTGASHRYEGITYDIYGSRAVAEIRAILGDVITAGTTGANVIVSYTTSGKVNRAPPHLGEVSFNLDGQPVTGTVEMQGFCRNDDYLLRAFRLAFARLLALNNGLEEAAVLDERGAFSEDFVGILRLMYGLPLGHDLAQYKAPRAPVAIAQVQSGEPKVGDSIIVDVSGSRGLEGAIAGYRLDQVHMGPETLEYMTEWKWEESEYLGEGRFRLVAGQPGRYAMKVTVIDDAGMSNTQQLWVDVDPEVSLTLSYRVLNLMDLKSCDFSTLERPTLEYISTASQANFVEFVHSIYYTQIDPVPRIEWIRGGDPVWETTPHSIELFLELAKEQGLGRILSVQLYPIDGVDMPSSIGRSRVWWDTFFDQLEPILLEQARFAEENSVEVFNVFYIDLINMPLQENARAVIWPRFATLLMAIRAIYSGLIGVATALGGDFVDPFNLTQYDDLLMNTNIDILFLNYGVRLFDSTEPNPDVRTLYERILRSFASAHQGSESYVATARRLEKPIIVRTAWVSAHRQNDFRFIDQARPASGYAHVVRDYSDQVRLYEATAAAMADPSLTDVFSGLAIQGFYFNDLFDIYFPPRDVVVPVAGDKAYNTRNKPAEALISFIFSHARAAQPR